MLPTVPSRDVRSGHDRPRIKLGYSVGYWSAGPPAGALEAIQEAERLGFDSRVDGRGVRLRRPHAARLVGRAHRAHPPRHRHRPAVGAHAGGDGDGGDHARPPLRRPLHPRPRRVRAAGRRGLVRPAVPEAARPHARVRRHRAPHRRPRRARRAPRRVLRPAARRRHGPRQGAEVDRPPAAHGDPDPHRRRGPEERRPGGRDRRRLAAAVLRPEGGRASTGECLQRGFAASGDAGEGRALRGRRPA